MKVFTNLTMALGMLAFVAMGCNMTKSQRGAMIGVGAGAAGGAIIGKVAGNTALGTVIGAAVGGTAGAIIGKHMDKQAAEIQEEIPSAKVERVEEGIRVEFNNKILFGFDQSNLGDQAKKNLSDLITILNKYPNTDIEVQGHTDNTGTADYNMKLSQRRADAVADYLRANGISSGRVTTKAFGLTAPAYPNDTEANRALNRRVEFIITANETMKEEAEKEAADSSQSNN